MTDFDTASPAKKENNDINLRNVDLNLLTVLMWLCRCKT